MIYCVWYPGGGFGHFVNAVLSLHGHGFQRPYSKTLNFSKSGDSHDLDLVLPKYYHDPSDYSVDIDSNFNYSVLVDNGNENEGERFRKFFSDANVIKICYSDLSWPVVAKTMIVKTSKTKFEDAVKLDDKWDCAEDWALREKYFLYLRDHQYRYMWKPSVDHVLWVEDLFDYTKLKQKLDSFGIATTNFELLWNSWMQSNQQYINPVLEAKSVTDMIFNRNSDLTHIADLWTQAIIYFYIWNKFGVEVPHNDYAEFFKSTKEIEQMIKELT